MSKVSNGVMFKPVNQCLLGSSGHKHVKMGKTSAAGE